MAAGERGGCGPPSRPARVTRGVGRGGAGLWRSGTPRRPLRQAEPPTTDPWHCPPRAGDAWDRLWWRVGACGQHGDTMAPWGGLHGTRSPAPGPGQPPGAPARDLSVAPAPQHPRARESCRRGREAGVGLRQGRAAVDARPMGRAHTAPARLSARVLGSGSRRRCSSLQAPGAFGRPHAHVRSPVRSSLQPGPDCHPDGSVSGSSALCRRRR